VLVIGIHRAARASVPGWLDAGDKPRHDNVTDTWQPLVLAGLGAFHGLNPAMGWLFAVALGLHRQSRTIVFVSLLPIAGGHAVSVAAVAGLLVATGTLLPQDLVRIGSGLLLLAWAAYHWRFGHRHRVRVGMQTGLWGLGVWSFLMATAHGAGLMLWPALMPSCLPDGARDADFAPVTSALAGVGVHTLAMIATTALVATLIYEWLGLAPLRYAWLNIDLAWLTALVATGTFLLLT
jgi:hypothetical protein